MITEASEECECGAEIQGLFGSSGCFKNLTKTYIWPHIGLESKWPIIAISLGLGESDWQGLSLGLGRYIIYYSMLQN